MNTRSTASSRTDGDDPRAPGPADESAAAGSSPGSDPAGPSEGTSRPAAQGAAHDAERRAFFFKFGKEAVTAMGQAVGMADIVGRTSSSVAANLLGLDRPDTPRALPEFTRSGRSAVVSRAAAPAAEDSFRSAYRLVGDELILLDQRGVPERLEQVTARRGSDVAYYLRLGVSRGGPVMAQVAAYGLALTATERADQPAAARDTELRRTQRALLEARPSSRLPAWAMQRMARVIDACEESPDGTTVATLLRQEADAIALDFQSANTAIAAGIAESLPRPEGRPLAVLVHGSQGAVAGGLVGTGLAALLRIRDEGRPVRVFVTEGRPYMDGARLTSWELRQAGIDHKVIPDAAAAWLFEREVIDAILIAAEWIAANGDAAGLIGSRALAQQAALGRLDRDGQGPAVVVHGVRGVIDLDTPDGASIPVELRPARDLSAYLADVPIRAADALVPATDVIPAGLIGALVTESGVAAPLDGAAIAALLADEAPG